LFTARFEAGTLKLVDFNARFGDRSRDDALVRPIGRVGVFLSSHLDVVPVEFARYALYAQALPEVVLFLTIESLNQPFVNRYQRCELKRVDLVNQIYWTIIKFGFAEQHRDGEVQSRVGSVLTAVFDR
jgi:K+ transporter